MKYVAIIAASVFFLGTGTGCATLLKSKTTNVPITSTSDVTVNGRPVSGPSVELSNKTDHAIAYKTPSGEPRTCEAKSSASTGWVVLSILAGGVGWIVDWATHNWNDLDTSSCQL